MIKPETFIYEKRRLDEKEFEEKYYSKKNIPMDVDQAFPVNNGDYPVYLHYYYLEDKEYPLLVKTSSGKSITESIE